MRRRTAGSTGAAPARLGGEDRRRPVKLKFERDRWILPCGRYDRAARPTANNIRLIRSTLGVADLQGHRFAGADWPDIIRRLALVSLGLFKTVGLLGQDAVMKGLGISPEDLAYGTVAKVLADEVKYRKDKGPLLPFLVLALKRDFLDLLRQKSWIAEEKKGDE